MPKAKGKNAFYFFMLDWKKREEKRGRNFPNGLKDVQSDADCDKEWREMSKQQKGVYEAMAKDSKIASQITLDKKTSAGESVKDLLERQRKEQEFTDRMREYIRTVVNMGIHRKSLTKLKFHLIHVNWFYIKEIDPATEEYYYCPAEFAIAEFSLEHGIGTVYHEIFNSEIPLGFKREALETKRLTHQLPIEYEKGQKDFAFVYQKIESLLRSYIDGTRFPPLYTLSNLRKPVQSLLKKLTDTVGKPEDTFLLYSLETLFNELWNVAIQGNAPPSIPFPVAVREFEKDVFAFVRGLECEYHKTLDGTAEYCSMSIVKRWAYTMCDHCCTHLNVKMIPSVHLPAQDAKENLSLNENFSGLSLNDTKDSKLDYNKLRNEARGSTDKQEKSAKCKPLEIIDHSKDGQWNHAASAVPMRPLRLPKSLPVYASREDQENYVPDEEEFPALGGRRTTPCKKEKK